MFWNVHLVQIFLPFSRESIQFSTFSGTEVLKAAEVEVSRGVYYDTAKKPIGSGLLDPHMVRPSALSFEVVIFLSLL